MTLDDRGLERLTALVGATAIPGDRYSLEARIGRGAMGEVWRARDRRLDRIVAVKVCSDARDAPRARRRFELEAKVVARLEHPSIPPVHDVGELEDGRPWYAMRLVPGRTLAAARDSLGSRNDRLRIFAKLLEPIAYAHRAGFVHRDLKPENVMIGPALEVYVMDWGLARERSAEGSAEVEASAAGTPGFLAPEQASGAAPDPRADVYALGGVLLHILGGDPMEHAPTIELPRALRAIVDKSRSEAPTERYVDAAEFARDIARFLDHEPVTAHRENVIERLGRLIDRHRFLVWLVLAYLIVRVLMVFFVNR